MTHRVIWSALFMLVLISLSRSWKQVRSVLVQLWQFGSIPLIALGLALSFAFYGLVRKKIGRCAEWHTN